MSGNGEKVGMVERVAAAIIRRNDFDFYMSADEAKAFARAAIEAMREPTQAMLDQGPPEPYMDASVWGKMISTALSASREEG